MIKPTTEPIDEKTPKHGVKYSRYLVKFTVIFTIAVIITCTAVGLVVYFVVFYSNTNSSNSTSINSLNISQWAVAYNASLYANNCKFLNRFFSSLFMFYSFILF